MKYLFIGTFLNYVPTYFAFKIRILGTYPISTRLLIASAEWLKQYKYLPSYAIKSVNQ